MQQIYKAQRRTIHIGDIPLEVAMLPDGSYRLSQTQVTAAIEKHHSSFAQLFRSKCFKLWLGFDSGLRIAITSVEIDGSNLPITSISVEAALVYWFKWAKKGNPKAKAITNALAKHSLYDRADAAFGVKPLQSECDRALAEDLSDTGVARIEAAYHLTTPKQNYTYLGLQADKSRFPLCKGITEEQAAKNASTHPLMRLVEEQWELWAALAWKRYLESGRGVVGVLLGKDFHHRMEKMATDFDSTVSIQEIPATYFGSESAEIHPLLTSADFDFMKFLNTVASYDPQKTICLSFDWDDDDTPGVQLVVSNKELSPKLCYEHLAQRLNEFTQEK